MKLIPEWRQAWRMASQRFSAAALVWLALPDESQARVLTLLWPSVTAEQVAGLLILLGMAGRLVVQKRVRKP